MALKPFFSLTPSALLGIGYDPADLTGVIVAAYGFTFGGATNKTRSIDAQSKNNEIVIAGNPAPLSNTSSSPRTYGGLELYIFGYHYRPENQILLLISLRSISGTPTAQVFVNHKLVRDEKLEGDEVIAALVDQPRKEQSVEIDVVLASDNRYSAMGFKGIDGYLL